VGDVQPPMDIEADAIVRALFKRNPDAAYRMTALAMSLSAQVAAVTPAASPRPKSWLAGLFDKRAAVLERRTPITS